MNEPETRASLLLRIRDPRDHEAWEEFASMYRPVVVNLACYRGMQAADAEDLAQQVLLALSQAIQRFELDPERGRFRVWLKTIARRGIINALTRGVPDRGAGGSSMLELLNAQPASGQATESLSLDYRREIFSVAAEQIRGEFGADTWRAFWRSVVDGEPVDQVAEEMGRSRGSIYTARSRVMYRLKQKVQELDLNDNQ